MLPSVEFSWNPKLLKEENAASMIEICYGGTTT